MCVIVFIGVLITLLKSNPNRTKTINRWNLLPLGIAIISLVVFAFALDDWYTITHQFETIVDYSHGSSHDRVQLLIQSINLGFEHPILGVGIGDWPVEIMQFDQSTMLTNGATIFYQSAHNDFVQILAESGILSALLYLVLCVVGLTNSLISWIRFHKIRSLSVLLAWILFMWVSLTNFPKERMEFLTVLSVLLVITPFPYRKLDLNRITPFFFAAFSLASITLFGLRVSQEMGFNDYDSGFNRSSGHFLFPLDSLSRPMEWHFGKELKSERKTKEAKSMFAKALKSNPYHPHIYFELADMAATDQMPELALEYIEKALSRTPNYQDARVLQAKLQYELGEKEVAFNSFLEADPYNPSLEYQQFGTQISTDSLINMMDNYPERELFLTIQAMKNTPEWAFGVIQKAAINGLPFSTQTIMEAVYYMFENCEGDQCNKVEAIRLKYVPNKDLNLPKSIKK
ncbi:MAG: hypothetical protein Salg2KO_08000 [Salibacteraceae bacterium]